MMRSSADDTVERLRQGSGPKPQDILGSVSRLDLQSDIGAVFPALDAHTRRRMNRVRDVLRARPGRGRNRNGAIMVRRLG